MRIALGLPSRYNGPGVRGGNHIESLVAAHLWQMEYEEERSYAR